MKLTKKIVASYLDTKCERKLFLSIVNKGSIPLKISGDERDRLNLPTPYKIRTRGLRITQDEGKKLENHYYDVLKSVFTKAVFDYSDEKSDNNALLEALAMDISNSQFDVNLILEATFETSSFYSSFLKNIQVAEDILGIIPNLTNMRPDIIAAVKLKHLKPFHGNVFEVLPDGQIEEINEDDQRTLLLIADIKSSEDANVSQFAEVALYAWLISNWLKANELDKDFAVIDSIGVWNRMSGFEEHAIFDDIESNFFEWYDSLSLSTFDQFMLPLRNFFIKDLPHVLDNLDKWQNLEYHLTPSCDTCDFLGRMDRDFSKYDDKIKHPDQLCAHKSFDDQHLSRIAGLAKGSRRSLNAADITQLPDLFDCAESVFDEHTELKKLKKVIPDRARSVHSPSDPSFFDGKDYTLAKFTNLAIMFHINYDMSLGQAASFSVQGAGFPWTGPKFPRNGLGPTFFERKTFLVDKESSHLELQMLKQFLDRINYMIETVSEKSFSPDPDFDINKKTRRPSIQFYCWDNYQLNFMKKILSRHIHILLNEKYSKTLLWLFSPEELLQHPDYYKAKGGRAKKLMAPYICVIKNVISKFGCLPLATTYPLLSVADSLDDNFNDPYSKISDLYKPQFGDYIPRERILEIWYDEVAKSDIEKESKKEENKGIGDSELRGLVHKRYISQYVGVCKKQVWALSSIRKIIAQSPNIENISYAPPIVYESILNLGSIKRLPADSQLWILFTLLDDRLKLLEHIQEVSLEIPAIESRFGCVLTKRKLTTQECASFVKTPSTSRQYFWVSEDSRNCKIREGEGFLTFLHVDLQGFPFMRPFDILRAKGVNETVIRGYERTFNHELYSQFHYLMSVSLDRFSRNEGWVEIYFYTAKIVDRLIKDGYLELGERIAFTKGFPLDRFKVVRACLKEIGFPNNVVSSPASHGALLRDYAENNKNKPVPRRSAEVLWMTDELRKNKDLKIDLDTLNTHIQRTTYLSSRHIPNNSQESAILDAVNNSVSVIWGPPGTGKTDTAVNILGAELFEAEANNSSQRILITGPTKRAVIEILNRFCNVLSGIDQERLTLITASGSSSTDYDFIMDDSTEWGGIDKRISCHGVGKNINTSIGVTEQYRSLSDVRDFILNAKSTDNIVVVATHYHMIYPLLTGISVKGDVRKATGKPMAELFDYILVDESSQIDVPNSIAILNSLDDSGSITFIGDHLQMLPIQAAPAPKGAEKLLGSIQEYLIDRFGEDHQRVLLENYRSVDEIVEFGKRIGYPSELIAKSNIGYLDLSETPVRTIEGFDNRLEHGLSLELLGGQKPTISIRYRDGMSGQANPFEAFLVVNMIVTCYEYLKSDLDEGDFTQEFWTNVVGVVTPHKAQRALVVRELTAIFPPKYHAIIDDAVDTVERFQGGERNFIVVSYGVGDEDIIKQEEDFLINLNRTNVAISRAKQKVVVMMSEELATHLTNNDELLHHAKAIKRFDHYCEMETKLTIPWLENSRELNYRYLSGS